MRDQVQEYIDRGEEMQDLSYLDFVRNTYDVFIADFNVDTLHKRSHNPTIPYLPNSGHHKHYRVLRREEHETMITFSGAWFPRADDVTQRPLYCASVLALLKPWRTLVDIKRPDTTFEDEFAFFWNHQNIYTKSILDNIQYFYECSDKAREKRIVTFFGHDDSEALQRHEKEDETLEEEGACSFDENKCEITEADVDDALKEKFTGRELLYAETAMNLANEFKIFERAATSKHIPYMAHRATGEDLMNEDRWMRYIADIEKERGGRYDDEDDDEPGEVVADEDFVMCDSGVEYQLNEVDSAHAGLIGDESELNEEQKIVYTILKNYLQQQVPVENKKPPHVLVFGAGGTGKTKIINALTNDLHKLG